jgi:glycosyltransferase involved in cell wall biosynthesis
MRKKIAVNTRILLKGKLEGMGWFAFETLKRITQQHPEHDFLFLFDRPYHQGFVFADNVTPLVLPPQARHPFLYLAWLELSIAYSLQKHKADLFLSPDGFLSLSSSVPQIPVIHDLNFEHYPDDVPFLTRKYYKTFFPRWAHKAARIATVSAFSRQDIISRYGIDADAIDVVYNGANEHYCPTSNEEQQQIRVQYANGAAYYVYIGSIHSRKNIVNMLKAFEDFKQQTALPIKLLLLGNKKWWTTEMEQTYLGMAHKHDVVFLGRQPDEVLHQVLAAALALVYVSRFEGFGIPILEAFYCDVPVITANVTAMPEVAGDAALLVDPFSVESIKDGMVKMAMDNSFRKELVLKAQTQRQKFTWQQSADNLWNCVTKVLES